LIAANEPRPNKPVKIPRMDALVHWKFWAIAALLASTIYVQFVGHQVEGISGLQRINNLAFYRVLFGVLHGYNGFCSGMAG
jgi:hypothetical protein